MVQVAEKVERKMLKPFDNFLYFVAFTLIGGFVIYFLGDSIDRSNAVQILLVMLITSIGIDLITLKKCSIYLRKLCERLKISTAPLYIVYSALYFILVLTIV